MRNTSGPTTSGALLSSLTKSNNGEPIKHPLSGWVEFRMPNELDSSIQDNQWRPKWIRMGCNGIQIWYDEDDNEPDLILLWEGTPLYLIQAMPFQDCVLVARVLDVRLDLEAEHPGLEVTMFDGVSHNVKMQLRTYDHMEDSLLRSERTDLMQNLSAAFGSQLMRYQKTVTQEPIEAVRMPHTRRLFEFQIDSNTGEAPWRKAYITHNKDGTQIWHPNDTDTCEQDAQPQLVLMYNDVDHGPTDRIKFPEVSEPISVMHVKADFSSEFPGLEVAIMEGFEDQQQHETIMRVRTFARGDEIFEERKAKIQRYSEHLQEHLPKDTVQAAFELGSLEFCQDN